MEWEHNDQTAPGERPAPSPGGGIGSSALARLEQTAPATGLFASAPPTPGDPDGTSPPQSGCFLPSDDLSGRARALPLVMG